MSANTRPSLASRLWRALIRILAIVAFLAILVAIAAGGYFGFIELQRSFDAVNTRMEAADRTVALLRSDVNTLMGENPEQMEQVITMQATVAALERQVSRLQTDLADDVAQQEEILNTLNEAVSQMSAQEASLTADLTTLNSALNALQGDINENGTRIDALGGAVDAVQTAVTGVETNLATVSKAETGTLPDALALFRVWELVTRARLRLLDDNIGLATNDVETAVRTLDYLLQNSTTLDAEKLEMVQARLALALVSLPTNTDSALSDLESAWDELDSLFETEILGIDATAVVADATPTPTATAGDSDATATATAGDSDATPTATPTP